MKTIFFATCFTIANFAHGLYSDSSPVVKLTEKNFKEAMVTNSFGSRK